MYSNAAMQAFIKLDCMPHYQERVDIIELLFWNIIGILFGTIDFNKKMGVRCI